MRTTTLRASDDTHWIYALDFFPSRSNTARISLTLPVASSLVNDTALMGNGAERSPTDYVRVSKNENSEDGILALSPIPFRGPGGRKTDRPLLGSQSGRCPPSW